MSSDNVGRIDEAGAADHVIGGETGGEELAEAFDKRLRGRLGQPADGVGVLGRQALALGEHVAHVAAGGSEQLRHVGSGEQLEAAVDGQVDETRLLAHRIGEYVVGLVDAEQAQSGAELVLGR